MQANQRFSPLGLIASAMHTKRDLLLPGLPECAVVASQRPGTRGMPVPGANKPAL